MDYFEGRELDNWGRDEGDDGYNENYTDETLDMGDDEDDDDGDTGTGSSVRAGSGGDGDRPS